LLNSGKSCQIDVAAVVSIFFQLKSVSSIIGAAILIWLTQATLTLGCEWSINLLAGKELYHIERCACLCDVQSRELWTHRMSERHRFEEVTPFSAARKLISGTWGLLVGGSGFWAVFIGTVTHGSPLGSEMAASP
jgi:hypothetical protein